MAKTTATPAAVKEEIEDLEFARVFEEHLRAGYQCLYIPTSEESRVEAEIAKVAANLQYGIVTWDCAAGFSHDALKGNQKYRIVTEALRALEEEKTVNGNHVFIFRDLDDFTADPTVRRLIRSLCEGNQLVNKRHKRPLVVVSPKLAIHDKLKACMYPLEFNLPGEEKLLKTFKFIQSSIESKDRAKAQCPEALQDQIIACLAGLTSTESENALARCLVRHGGFKPEMLGTIKDEKASIIKKSEVLTYIPEESTARREDIGGFDRLLPWFDRRQLAYEKHARDLNIDYPKGIVLLGIPGTGKSYVAKAVARLLGLPGYVLDVGSIFGSLVGESESRLRDALRQIKAQRGCVLLIDEADKAFGGAADSQGDSGVTRRVFGQLLTWLSEKQDRTFVIMTMNRTVGIPPEFLRAGRFDAVFYTDLPTADERKQILEIHFRKRSVNVDQLQLGPAEWKAVVEKTTGFVGSELEEVVREARYLAYENRRDGAPNFEELLQAASVIVPMSQRDSESVEKIREFCKDRAMPVSSPARDNTHKRSRAVDVDN